jgi:hypothetical protein
MTAIPPLLRLMAGKKARPRKAPRVRPREMRLHLDVARVLLDHSNPEWFWWHTPNGGKRDIITASLFKKMGVKPGVFDFVLVAPSAVAHFLELKREGESLSDAQEKFQLHAIKHGWPHSVADSFDTALAALDHWGALRIRIGGAR